MSELLSKTLLARIQADDIPIRFNGHHGVVSDQIVYTESPFSKDRYPLPTDWLFGGLAKHMLDLQSSIIKMCDSIDEHTREPDVDALLADGLHRYVLDWISGTETDWFTVSDRSFCHHCGVGLVCYFNGIELMFREPSGDHGIENMCAHPGGISSYKVTVEVPSGELVFANDLRRLMPAASMVNADISNNAGIMETVKGTASQGFLTAFVGNSCPDVIQSKDGSILIANNGYDENDMPAKVFGITLGAICTDLWWFYATDSSLVDAAVKSDTHTTIVKCEPGTYEMEVHSPRPNDDDPIEDGELYATIRRVG